MVTAELLSFIEQETALGIEVESIKAQLKNGGWQDADIEEGFAVFAQRNQAPLPESSTPAAPSPTSPPPQATVSQAKPHKKFHISKGFVWIIGLVLFFFLALASTTLVLGLVYPDIAQVNDSELQLPPTQIPEDKNAYFDVLEAVQQGARYVAATSTPAEKDVAIKAMFSAYGAAGSKEFYQDPATANTAALTASALSPQDLQKVANSVNTFALQTAQAGSSTEALSLATLGVVIGTKIEKSQDTYPMQSVAMNMRKESLQTVLHLATSTRIKSPQLITIAYGLSDQAIDGMGLVRADMIEYQKKHDLFLRLDSGSARALGIDFLFRAPFTFFNATGYVYQPRRTVAMLADSMRVSMHAHAESCDTQTGDVVPAAGNTAQNRTASPLDVFKPNGAGTVLIATVVTFPPNAKAKQCDVEVLRGAVEIVLAVKAFEQDHKALPKTLTELVPTYLPSVPQGPYTATTTTYRYDPARRIVYSLGAARIDKGGNVPENPTYSF